MLAIGRPSGSPFAGMDYLYFGKVVVRDFTEEYNKCQQKLAQTLKVSYRNI